MQMHVNLTILLGVFSAISKVIVWVYCGGEDSQYVKRNLLINCLHQMGDPWNSQKTSRYTRRMFRFHLSCQSPGQIDV